jgi:hypothetical protein
MFFWNLFMIKIIEASRTIESFRILKIKNLEQKWEIEIKQPKKP